MKKILNIIVFALCSFLFAQAQLVQPVKWSGEELGDSVRLRAAIQPGWHMTIIEFGQRTLIVANIYIRFIRRLACYLYPLCVADYSDDCELLPEERRRTA